MTISPLKRNIAVFGPTHAGKSSLVGYLTVRTSLDSRDWPRFVQGIQRELGTEYLPAQKFAYVVDTGKEERESHCTCRNGYVKGNAHRSANVRC